MDGMSKDGNPQLVPREGGGGPEGFFKNFLKTPFLKESMTQRSCGPPALYKENS